MHQEEEVLLPDETPIHIDNSVESLSRTKQTNVSCDQALHPVQKVRYRFVCFATRTIGSPDLHWLPMYLPQRFTGQFGSFQILSTFLRYSLWTPNVHLISINPQFFGKH